MTCRFIVFIVLKILLRFEVCGRGHIPASGGVILAANHISNLDPPLLGLGCQRHVRFLAKSELFNVPVLGWLLQSFGCIPVRRGRINKETFRSALDALTQGEVVAVFPQGTRSAGTQKRAPLGGVGYLAVKSRARVVPVYIQGTERALPKGARFIRPYKVRITFGEPLEFSQVAFVGQDEVQYKEISRVVMDNVDALAHT